MIWASTYIVHIMKPAQEKDTMARQAVGKSLSMFPE